MSRECKKEKSNIEVLDASVQKKVLDAKMLAPGFLVGDPGFVVGELFPISCKLRYKIDTKSSYLVCFTPQSCLKRLF